MSFKSELTVSGKTFSVRRFYASVHRDTDDKGRPVSMPAWSICVIIDAVNDTTITSWMIDPKKQLDGKLTIYKIDQDSKLKEIVFKKSYCFHLREEFRSDYSYSSTLLFIKGKELKINTAELKQNWPGN